MSDKKRCDKCEFWIIEGNGKTGAEIQKILGANEEDNFIGTCVRYPPVLDNAYASTADFDEHETCECNPLCWQQPLTFGNSWCGEFSYENKSN